MYTVSKGPSKIVAKTRRGLSQNYDKFETIKEIGKKSTNLNNSEAFNVPRPVFQTVKKSPIHSKNQTDEERLTPQHEEIVKYINESWNMIVAHNPYDNPSSDSNQGFKQTSPPSTTSSFYCVEPPSPALSDFKPFDLESWWGRRLFNNITKSL